MTSSPRRGDRSARRDRVRPDEPHDLHQAISRTLAASALPRSSAPTGPRFCLRLIIGPTPDRPIRQEDPRRAVAHDDRQDATSYRRGCAATRRSWRSLMRRPPRPNRPYRSRRASPASRWRGRGDAGRPCDESGGYVKRRHGAATGGRSDLSTIGLSASFAGVILLFRYGMPYRVPTPHGGNITTVMLTPSSEGLTLATIICFIG